MHQGQAPVAVKPGTKPVMSNPAVDPNSTDEQRMFPNRQPLVFDGKRMRKPVARKTIDYNSSVVKYLENRKWFKSLDSRHTIQPDESYATEVLPPFCMMDNPTNAVTTKFVRTSTNKLRCPIFCVVWTPEGRRLVTGASSGEFTLWNGLTFNFETILTAHDLPVRAMVWSHNDSWLLSGDHGGVVKYWQSNMNNVQMYEAHKEPIRGLSFAPTDNKYASCADDGLVKIWDFYRCTEEKVLRGHGADVKCLDWHPTKSILVSGSKDSQQPIKIWDTRTGNSLATLHLHKSTVMSLKWNQNGNWLLTASRDHLLKLFDIRVMKEVQSFRGHKREATAIAWHPIHETLFASGGSDGSIMFWNAGVEKDVGNMESAHDGMVWSLAWHPLGHILCSGSNDHSSKFWTRNRLGDRMRDKYNLNMQDTEDDLGDDIISGAPGFSINHTMAIPGMESAAADTDALEYDGLDHSILPGFRGPQRFNEPEAHPRLDRPVIPGFLSPKSKSNQQLPPFANQGEGPGPKFGPPNDFGPRSRDGDFVKQQRNQNTGEKERHWRPPQQQNRKFPPGPPQEQRPQEHRPQEHRPQEHRPQEHRPQEHRPQEHRPQEHRPQEHGPPNDAREHHGPDGWGPPPREPREIGENRGGRGNEPRFGSNFPRGTHGPRRVLQNNVDQGILGSPPHGPDGLRPETEGWPRGSPQGGRMGLLGSPPPPFSGPPNSRAGILGPQPPSDQEREEEARRSGGEREEPRDLEGHGGQAGHPHDLGSRGFRRGMVPPRKGGDTTLQRPPQQDLNDERNGENQVRGRGPFQRGGREDPRDAQGPDDNRRPWPPNSGPINPRFRRPEEHDHSDRRPFDRQQPWEEPPENEPTHPHDFRRPPPNHGPRDFGPPPRDIGPPPRDQGPPGPPPREKGPPPRDIGPPPRDLGPPGPSPRDIGPPTRDHGPPSRDLGPPSHDIGPPPRDPRGGPHYGRGPPQDIDTRDPRGLPDPPERQPSDDPQRLSENKPRPLMSLMSLNPIIPTPSRNIEHEDPDRPPIQRKRSGEGELDREREREWDINIGPPQKMRFPPGPPEDRRDSRGERPFPEEPVGWRGRGGMR